MKIGLTVCMNSVTAAGPQQDGYLKVEIDGETKIEYGKLVWRKTTNIKVDNIFISTFYGGGDPSWAPSRDTYALFRNFKVYR